MRAIRWVLGVALAAVITVVATTAVTRSGLIDELFPPEKVSCPTTSTSSGADDPKPTADAVVVHDGSASGSNGNVVSFKICRDTSASAPSEFWYFGMSPGPSSNLVPAARVREEPARYETGVSDSTFYFVDCGTNTFGYSTDGTERAYLFDEGEC